MLNFFSLIFVFEETGGTRFVGDTYEIAIQCNDGFRWLGATLGRLLFRKHFFTWTTFCTISIIFHVQGISEVNQILGLVYLDTDYHSDERSRAPRYTFELYTESRYQA